MKKIQKIQKKNLKRPISFSGIFLFILIGSLFIGSSIGIGWGITKLEDKISAQQQSITTLTNEVETSKKDKETSKLKLENKISSQQQSIATLTKEIKTSKKDKETSELKIETLKKDKEILKSNLEKGSNRIRRLLRFVSRN